MSDQYSNECATRRSIESSGALSAVGVPDQGAAPLLGASLRELVGRFFACKHPAAYLHTAREHTVSESDKYPEDYDIVTYHLYCLKCGAKVPVSHARCIGGVDGLMKRARARYRSPANNPVTHDGAQPRSCV